MTHLGSDLTNFGLIYGRTRCLLCRGEYDPTKKDTWASVEHLRAGLCPRDVEWCSTTIDVYEVMES